jgi:hypothetical protein
MSPGPPRIRHRREAIHVRVQVGNRVAEASSAPLLARDRRRARGERDDADQWRGLHLPGSCTGGAPIYGPHLAGQRAGISACCFAAYRVECAGSPARARAHLPGRHACSARRCPDLARPRDSRFAANPAGRRWVDRGHRASSADDRLADRPCRHRPARKSEQAHGTTGVFAGLRSAPGRQRAAWTRR